MKIKYFGATWCQPCKVLKPMVEEVAKELGIEVEYIDIEEEQDLTINMGVRGVPTIFKIDDENGIDAKVGMQTKAQLKEWLED